MGIDRAYSVLPSQGKILISQQQYKQLVVLLLFVTEVLLTLKVGVSC